jgi:hypothetical protein
MLDKLVIGALGAMAVMFSSTAFAQGTATEAKAMLEEAAVAVKADKAMTFDTINKGEGGFLDRDLYVFCFNIGDGKAVASGSTNPAAKKTISVDVRTLKDATGKVFGQGLYDGAKEGQITEVSYMFPKPGTDTTPVAKISLVTKVGDLGCGVGYYKSLFLFLLRQQVRSRALQSAYAVGHRVSAVEMSGTYGVYSSKQATINH